MARLYADENFPFPVVEELRSLGHDVLTMVEDGQANKRVSDEQVLTIAYSKQRTLLTTNRKHFIRLHNDNAPHSGIIVCTFDPDFVGQAKRIDQAIRDHEDLARALIRVNRSVT
jgi:hypothetical protein